MSVYRFRTDDDRINDEFQASTLLGAFNLFAPGTMTFPREEVRVTADGEFVGVMIRGDGELPTIYDAYADEFFTCPVPDFAELIGA